MSQDFFTANRGRYVLRDGRPYRIPDFNDPKKDYEVAKLLFELQEYGITFKPMAKVIHTQQVCVSCEG